MAPRVMTLLAAIDMAPETKAQPGLVRADRATLVAKKRANASPEEIIALERAIYFKADYIYFRRPVERPTKAMAYVYDWTGALGEERRSSSTPTSGLPKALSNRLGELHSDLWSASEIPLVFVFLPTAVHIYHILQGPEKASAQGIEPNPWQTIELAGDIAEAIEALKAFSARKLDDGTFWEQHPESRALKLEGAAFMALSQEIGRCRHELVKEHGLGDALVKRMLILFVMIKYLEERKDRDGQVFPDGTFSTFADEAVGFVDLLRAGGPVVLAFLDHLAGKDRFNGDVFRLDPDERRALSDANLGPFADLLDARIERGQRTFWRRYSFRELPVELISHLYEQFLPRQPGVVYTPPFLVNFILDEVLPLSQSTPDSFRLLDPACGSGVFLVGAFRRLVNRWRRDNDYLFPDVAALKSLLRKHIFGGDLEAEAVRLTMFSLSVALCDFLRPRVIWEELHFDHLQASNLKEGDFFAHVRGRSWDDRFDLVIGNPPFQSKLTESASAEVAELRAEVAELRDKGRRFHLPDRQVALLFLKTCTRIAKPGGQVALIQPSGPFLYGEKSERFRRHFLQRVQVDQIVDFTHLSRVLFKRQRIPGAPTERGSNNPADVAVAVVFARNGTPTGEPLLHVTVRRTVQAEQKLMIEIDHYDLHFVSRAEALDNPGIWKANFAGGGRVPHLLHRLGRLRSLGDFIAAREREKKGWIKGEGYIAGDEKNVVRIEALRAKEEALGLSTEEARELKYLNKRYRKAQWLTGHKVLPTEAFKAEGADWSKVEPIREDLFAEPRCPELFSGPVLLIKELVEVDSGRIPVLLAPDGARFKDRVLGIHAPRTDVAHLRRIQKLVEDNDLTLFHLLATSAEFLVNKSSALREADFLRLPFPESDDDLDLSPIDMALIEDTLAHVADFKRMGASAESHRWPKRQELVQFGKFFCRILGSVYPNVRPADPVDLPGGICFPFYFGAEPSLQITPGNVGALKLARLLNATIGPSLRCQRVIRMFHGNMILLVKPPQLRYWLRSIAVRDADDVFAELQERGH